MGSGTEWPLALGALSSRAQARDPAVRRENLLEILRRVAPQDDKRAAYGAETLWDPSSLCSSG